MSLFASFWASAPALSAPTVASVAPVGSVASAPPLDTTKEIDPAAELVPKEQLTENTSDESYIKVNANDLIMAGRTGSDLPVLYVAAEDMVAAVEAAHGELDNVLTEDPSIMPDNISMGEETAAAVLEELEHQERLEQQEQQQQQQQQPVEEEDIDLCLVEQYDNAFNEFIFRNPRFLVINPDLVHNLRVAKLQKLLERHDRIETELSSQLESVKEAKHQMEQYYQNQLKDAARRKAARDIHWQAHLEEIQHSSKTMEAQLTWDLLTANEIRTKQEVVMVQELSAMGYGRHSVETLIPRDPDFDGVRDAIMAPPNLSNQEPLSEEQQNDLRQFQVDNAFLNAEVSVLQKKLAYQEMEAKKHSWVENVLLRMDEKTMKKLKSKYQRKTGVQV